MALTATIFKATLQIADMDRNYYADHALTLARHPSETDERMMVRLLAFALHAQPGLIFGKGLSAADEADIWQKDLTGTVDVWIDVGQPDEKAIRKACNRAREVFVYTYGGRISDTWWGQHRDALMRLDNLAVTSVALDTSRALAKLVQRTMQLHCTIQDGQIWIADGTATVQIESAVLKAASTAARY